MAAKNLYEDLLRYYEFQIGKMPRREKFKSALEETFSIDDLKIFFQLPYLGFMSEDKFMQKVLRIGISEDVFTDTLSRLIPKGLVDKFQKNSVWGFERAPVIVVLEMAVRESEDSNFRQVTAEVMNDLIEGAAETIPTKTPYYRVLPVEPVIKKNSRSTLIEINAEIPDTRQVLPIDVISEMLKEVDLIALSNCYCRSAKKIIGEPCDHPLETCFYFDELAQMKLQTDYARQVGYEEAMKILYECETQGLVHNVSNCEGKIQTLCNCCECSCAVLKAWNRGLHNTTSPSRYVIALDENKCSLQKSCVDACPVSALSIENDHLMIDQGKCLGCGICVAACSEHALHLEMRVNPPKIFKDNDALYRSIYVQSAFGLIGRKLGLGK
jgi:Fe-S-cluster-containing hydrogenase component 2